LLSGILKKHVKQTLQPNFAESLPFQYTKKQYSKIKDKVGIEEKERED
jgi:hypothetical protein